MLNTVLPPKAGKPGPEESNRDVMFDLSRVDGFDARHAFGCMSEACMLSSEVALR